MSVQRRVLLVSAFLPILYGCNRKATQTKSGGTLAGQFVTVRIGQSGESFILANGRDRVNVKREPVGLNFYSIDWPTKLPGEVRVDHQSYSFRIEGALGVLGSEDKLLPQEGLSSFHIGAGITIDDTIAHSEARDHIMAMLQMLLTIGWRRSIARSDPRLRGAEAVSFSIKELGIYSLDPTYVPTMKEWMALGDTAMWDFSADGVYLRLQFRRDTDRMDVNAPGAYFLSWGLWSEADELTKAFVSKDRPYWKALWPERDKSLRQERADTEAKMRALGWTIDTDYNDPPVLNLARP